jgi:hypothetical protein
VQVGAPVPPAFRKGSIGKETTAGEFPACQILSKKAFST